MHGVIPITLVNYFLVLLIDVSERKCDSKNCTIPVNLTAVMPMRLSKEMLYWPSQFTGAAGERLNEFQRKQE